MLYSGGFFSNDDRARMNVVRESNPEQLANLDLPFEDSRLPEMLFRFRARNYPETLNKEELVRWNEFRITRINDANKVTGFSLDDFFQRINDLREEETDESKRKMLNELEQYAQNLIE